MESLTYLVLAFLLGIFVGICLLGFVLWYVLSHFLVNPEEDQLKSQQKQQPASSTFQVPPILITKINDESFKSKENCWAINFILYFLFRELRNSQQIRRWILRKLAMEFDEILATSVLGKFFSSITIQNIDMGQNFPIINWLKTTKVEMHPVSNCISTLDILADLNYSGGFTFAIKAETHLKHSAFLSVKIKEVKGKARLEFTTEPYAHWSISFSENPDIDIAVASQLYGKSFVQITSIIAAQLKRSVRKKHTLPMFKIRYKPFFTRLEHVISALLPQTAPQVQTTGALSVSVIECRGIMSSLIEDHVYATAGIADFDWVAIYPAGPESKTVFVVRDVICVRSIKRETNLDFTLTQRGDVPIVDSVNPLLSSYSISQAVLSGTVEHGASSVPSCPELAIEHGDEIIAVDGKNVSTVKHCIKNFKNSTSVKVVWRVRRKLSGATIPLKDDTPGDNTCKGVTEEVQENKPQPAVNSTTTNTTDLLEDEIENITINSRYLTYHALLGDIRTHVVMKTKVLRNSRDPIFQETFDFDVTERNRFLNITLWSAKNADENDSSDSTPNSSPAKRKNTKRLEDSLPFGKDRVLGSLSIPLNDIITECSNTGMGYFVKDFYLCSPDGSAIDAKDHSLKDHSGFDPHFCYGKITLSFLYKSMDDDIKRKTSLVSNTDILNEIGVGAGNISPTDETQPHRFIRTHFRSATICDYCNKKIWLKEAFICNNCNMKCHKKCYERCIANTTCRGQLYQAKPAGISGLTPEIIMTTSETITPTSEKQEENGNIEGADNSTLQANNGSGMAVRRRTLGGLLVSAVQNRSSQLRRVGSATALVPPTLSPSSASKSLPPSPQSSPIFNRKTTENSTESQFLNPFQVLDKGNPDSFEEDLKTTVEHLIKNPNDDFVSLAKETGRDAFEASSIPERKIKLNQLLNRLQEEINTVSNERLAFEKEDMKSNAQEKVILRQNIATCEDKVKALALLMLHYCAGLQHVQELEDIEKEALEKNALNLMTTCVNESEENEEEFSSGLLSNLSASTTCLLEQDED